MIRPRTNGPRSVIVTTTLLPLLPITRTAAQCREWMSHVGFRDIRTQLLDDVHTAVIGIKGDR